MLIVLLHSINAMEDKYNDIGFVSSEQKFYDLMNCPKNRGYVYMVAYKPSTNELA